MSIELWRADDGGVAALQGRLQGAVFAEFALDPELDAAGIKVAVTGRVVTLSGTVASYPARIAAERAAQRVRGVQEVVDELRVTLEAHHHRSDWELAVAASQALQSNVLVPRDSVTATVTGGWIRLAGQVSRGSERSAAGEAVERLIGLRGVQNEITVATAVPPGDLRTRVTAALEHTPGLRARRLDVGTRRGTVVLQGVVRTLAERDHAERVVWQVRGVSVVRNMVRVRR
jgi:osmotically-inducible protein OsmY